jgi:hypothetical protein
VSNQGVVIHATAPTPVHDLLPPSSAEYITPASEAELLALLGEMNREYAAKDESDSRLEGRIASYELAAKMQLSVPGLFDLGGETEATRQLYGLGEKASEEFGTRCLLARRMLERGVRFVQVWSGPAGATGNWDNHADVSTELPAIASMVDRPIAGLLADLESRGMFEDTLVVFSTEFGRQPFSQGTAGRDHNGGTFVGWLAGAGIRAGATHGESDEWGWRSRVPTWCYDLHATILHLPGIDHTRLTFRHNGSDRRLTDVHGELIPAILACSRSPTPDRGPEAGPGRFSKNSGQEARDGAVPALSRKGLPKPVPPRVPLSLQPSMDGQVRHRRVGEDGSGAPERTRCDRAARPRALLMSRGRGRGAREPTTTRQRYEAAMRPFPVFLTLLLLAASAASVRAQDPSDEGASAPPPEAMRHAEEIARADALIQGGHADQAVEILRVIAEQDLAELGEQNPFVVKAFSNLSYAQGAAGNLEEARRTAYRALEIAKSQGEPSVSTAMVERSLAEIAERMGEIKEAQVWIEDACRDLEATYGRTPMAAETREIAARIAFALGDLDAAQDHLERSLAINERYLGVSNEATARPILPLATILAQRGQLRTAVLLHQTATHPHGVGVEGSPAWQDAISGGSALVELGSCPGTARRHPRCRRSTPRQRGEPSRLVCARRRCS